MAPAMWSAQPFGVVNEQTNVGLLGTKDMVHAIEKVLHHTHAPLSMKPGKLTRASTNNVCSLERDKMKNFSLACMLAQDTLSDIHTSYTNLHFGVSQAFVDPLRVFYKKNQVIRRKLELQINKEQANLKATLELLDKERAVCQSHMDLLNSSKSEKVQKKCSKQLQVFEKRMVTARIQHHEFYNKSLPKALAELEDIERSRLGLLQAHLEHFHEKVAQLAEHVQVSAMGLQAAISELDVERDMKACYSYWDGRYKHQQLAIEPPLNPFPSSSSLAKQTFEGAHSKKKTLFSFSQKTATSTASTASTTGQSFSPTAMAMGVGMAHPRRLSQPTLKNHRSKKRGKKLRKTSSLNMDESTRQAIVSRAANNPVEKKAEVESKEFQDKLGSRQVNSGRAVSIDVSHDSYAIDVIKEEQECPSQDKDTGNLNDPSDNRGKSATYFPSYKPPARRKKQHTPTMFAKKMERERERREGGGGDDGGGDGDDRTRVQPARGRSSSKEEEEFEKSIDMTREKLSSMPDPHEVKVQRQMSILLQRGRKNYRASVMSPIHMHLAGLVQDADLDLSDDDEGDDYEDEFSADQDLDNPATTRASVVSVSASVASVPAAGELAKDKNGRSMAHLACMPENLKSTDTDGTVGGEFLDSSRGSIESGYQSDHRGSITGT